MYCEQSTMKSIAATLLCSLLLMFLVTTDESQRAERGLQVVLCRCEKKTDNLHNRRLRGFDENPRNLGTFQDSEGYYIVYGIRVLPLDDEDCVGKKKRQANIFDNRQLWNVQGETDEQERELDGEVTGRGEGMEEDREDIGSNMERQLKRVLFLVGLSIAGRRLWAHDSLFCYLFLSFICRETVSPSGKSTNPVEAFINDIALGIIDSKQGSNLSIDAVQSLANSNADTIEAQTGVTIDDNLVDTNQSYSTFNPANYQQYTANTNLITAASFQNLAIFANFLQSNLKSGNLNAPNFQGSISTPTMPVFSFTSYTCYAFHACHSCYACHACLNLQACLFLHLIYTCYACHACHSCLNLHRRQCCRKFRHWHW